MASSPVSVRKLIAWDGRHPRRHEPSLKRWTAAVRLCIVVVLHFPSITKLFLSGVPVTHVSASCPLPSGWNTQVRIAGPALLSLLFLSLLFLSLLLDTYDLTSWIPAHLVWQTSEKYPSRNSSVDQNGLSTLGSNESARRGEKKPPIAASRYQQYAIQTSPS